MPGGCLGFLKHQQYLYLPRALVCDEYLPLMKESISVGTCYGNAGKEDAIILVGNI